MAPDRPVLRYHGGKYKLAEWVISHFPPHRIYCEPFGGAASILMAKPRCPVEIYNDLDERIVGLFRVLRDKEQSVELERLLRLTPYARAEYEASHEETDDPVEAARRLIVRSFMGFGSASLNSKTSGFRTKWSGSYVPCAVTWANYTDSLPVFQARLQGVTIERKPAVHLLAQCNHVDALIYADPPYVPETRRHWHASCRYRYDMTQQDHRDLADALRSTKAMVALSGYPSELYDELYSDWEQVCIEARIEYGGIRTEVLWLSPNLTQRLHPTLF